MKNNYVTDTMALVLRLEKRRLSRKVKAVQIDPITEEIIHKSFEIDDIPELHDRIIAGTACLKSLELVTNDPIIINSKFVSTIW